MAELEPHHEVATFAAAHGDSLLRFAYLLTGGDAAEAEDPVYSVFTRLVERGLDGLDDPAAYARTSIANAQRSELRKRLVRRDAQQMLTRDHASPSSPDDRLTLFAALGDLSERERLVVVLRYYEDFDDQTIAEVLRCPRATMRSLAHRAMPKLRARLGSTYRADPSDEEGSDDRP